VQPASRQRPGFSTAPPTSWQVTTEQLVAPYPMRRAGTPEEVAAVVVFLASDAAYVSGHVIGIDGGDLA
jgi:NAD(P)-dependent dehydrogenase (short-subunit alcohol dehydrogenase family)